MLLEVEVEVLPLLVVNLIYLVEDLHLQDMVEQEVLELQIQFQVQAYLMLEEEVVEEILY
jgi:hypothetical protein